MFLLKQKKLLCSRVLILICFVLIRKSAATSRTTRNKNHEGCFVIELQMLGFARCLYDHILAPYSIIFII